MKGRKQVETIGEDPQAVRKKNLRASWREKYKGKKGVQDRSELKGESDAAGVRLENREKHTHTKKKKKQDQRNTTQISTRKETE